MIGILAGGRIVLRDRVVDGWLRIDDRFIAAVGEGEPPSGHPVTTDAGGRLVVPGFVDVHCHGGGGAAIYTGDLDDVRTVARAHLAAGTTAMFGSIATTTAEVMIRAARAIAEAASDGTAPNLVGVHVEGPFLSPARRGAQTESALRLPDRRLMSELIDAVGELPLTMTIAPELPGALALIEEFSPRCVFAIGHTAATFAEATAAVDRGARSVTHTFNGMSPFGHREPGAAGVALTDTRVSMELIADGHHVHDAVARVAIAAAGPDRVVLVTDASAAAGLGDGDYAFVDRRVTVAGGRVTLTGTETLAGSAIRLVDAYRHVRSLGADETAASAMASANAARLVGLTDRGTIRPGTRADLVLLEDDLSVHSVLLAGALVS